VKNRAGTVVRGLYKGDLTELLEIERACFPDPWPTAWFRAAITGGDICWGAFLGEHLIAYLIACYEGDHLHLTNLAVHFEHRRCGVASSLVSRLLDEARDRGFRGVLLEVRRSNVEAIRLYERFGFQATGIEELYYEGIEDALIMSLEINGLV